MTKTANDLDADVVIVGAGAAGLMAAHTLTTLGRRAIVVEATGRVGGRVHTIRRPEWPLPIEVGAEFLHGSPSELPVVEALIERSRSRAITANEGMWHLVDGKLRPKDDEAKDKASAADDLLSSAPDVDVSAAERIESAQTAGTITAEEAASLRGYVEGFYAANAGEISSRALAREEQGSGAMSGTTTTHRWLDGYDRLLEPLAMAADVRFDHAVHAIDVRETDRVIVRSRSRAGFARGDLRARAVIVTASIAVLQSGAIAFEPPLPAESRAAIDGFRMGHVARISLRFRAPFWLAKAHYDDDVDPSTLGYVRVPPPDAMSSDPAFWPVWWTQNPTRTPVLVGWAGGPLADRLGNLADAEKLAAAIDSIARGFGIARAIVEANLEDWCVSAWQHEPFVRGAYAYPLVGHEHAAAELAKPVEGKLYIAGEATCVAHAGTVHGALESGEQAARQCARRLA